MRLCMYAPRVVNSARAMLSACSSFALNQFGLYFPNEKFDTFDEFDNRLSIDLNVLGRKLRIRSTVVTRLNAPAEHDTAAKHTTSICT